MGARSKRRRALYVQDGILFVTHVAPDRDVVSLIDRATTKCTVTHHRELQLVELAVSKV